MKIRIRSEDANFTLPIPTGLLLNPLTAGLLPKLLEEYGIHVTGQQIMGLYSAIKQFSRRNKDFVLVEVHSADGEEVLIKL